ncbi:MAG TPA: hypothetical protein VFG12_05850 [Rhodopila sp.]|jgi:hypothetical protein|nr:hypothetical protein [Rhodopila sp.]
MKPLILAALAAVTLAACSNPTLNGGSDTPAIQGTPHAVYPTAPYDNTANSPLGGYDGGGDASGGN